MFPAHAGMIPFLFSVLELSMVFPAHAGMILVGLLCGLLSESVPRTCGDDPRCENHRSAQ